MFTLISRSLYITITHKGRSLNIDVYHNPNNVRKGGGGNGHVRIVFQVKISIFFTIRTIGRTHRHSGAYIKLLDSPHPATTIINTVQLSILKRVIH